MSFDSDSNDKTESKEQPRKHFVPRISTDAGIQIERSETQKYNAPNPISFKYDTGTNITSDRSRHSAKQLLSIDSIEEPTENDLNDLYPNLFSGILAAVRITAVGGRAFIQSSVCQTASLT
jgi:hypothetical protein